MWWARRERIFKQRPISAITCNVQYTQNKPRLHDLENISFKEVLFFAVRLLLKFAIVRSHHHEPQSRSLAKVKFSALNDKKDVARIKIPHLLNRLPLKKKVSCFVVMFQYINIGNEIGEFLAFVHFN